MLEVAELVELLVTLLFVVLAILEVLKVETVAASELDRGRVFAVVLGVFLVRIGDNFISDCGAFELCLLEQNFFLVDFGLLHVDFKFLDSLVVVFEVGHVVLQKGQKE